MGNNIPRDVIMHGKGWDKSLGHIALALMLLCGLTIAWLYASVRRTVDLTSIGRIIQGSGIELVFRNQTQLAVVATAGLTGAALDPPSKPDQSEHIIGLAHRISTSRILFRNHLVDLDNIRNPSRLAERPKS